MKYKTSEIRKECRKINAAFDRLKEKAQALINKIDQMENAEDYEFFYKNAKYTLQDIINFDAEDYLID